MRNKKIYKLFISLILIVGVMFSTFRIEVNAVIFNANASDNGDGSITVTISGKCVGGFTVSTGNISVSVGKTTLDSDATVRLNTGYGEFEVTVSAISVSDANYQLVDGSVKTTVVVTNPNSGSGGADNTPSGGGSTSGGGSQTNNSGGTTTNTPTTPETPEEPKSTNNNLSGLTVSTGTLSPEFNVDTTEYTVTLPADATTISIDASAEDEKATVEGTGEHTLKAGTNEIGISVTAENGDVKTYYVKVNVDETPLVYTTLDNQKLGVVRNTDEIGVPSTFEETTVTLDGQEVKAWNSTQMNKTIVFLVNDAGEKNFYLFENNQVTSIFKPVGLFGKNLYIINVPEDKQKIKGMTFGEIVINDEKFSGWTFEDEAFANYAVIYVMDELGNIKYYQYEKTENSLQLYSMAAPTTQEAVDKLNGKVSTQQMIIYALIATTVVGGGLAAYAFYQLVQSKKNGTYNKKFDYTNEDE